MQKITDKAQLNSIESQAKVKLDVVMSGWACSYRCLELRPLHSGPVRKQAKAAVK